MNYRLKGTDEYTQVYNRGLEDEETVLDFLFSTGEYSVAATEEIEDQLSDIDCYINGIPASIKAEHEGARYGNIYFELVTQRGRKGLSPELTLAQTESLTDLFSRVGSVPFANLKDGSWFPGWFHLSKAKLYIIWQGDQLMIFQKKDILAYIRTSGFRKVLGLSWKVLQQQHGKNTICGYINTNDVKPIKTYTLPRK